MLQFTLKSLLLRRFDSLCLCRNVTPACKEPNNNICLSATRQYARLLCTVAAFLFAASAPQYANANEPESALSTKPAEEFDSAVEVDFGEEGDIIFKVYLGDILLTEGMYSITREGRIYLPLSEITSLLDFPIIVDVATGKATGWFLNPANTFFMDSHNGTVVVMGKDLSITKTDVFSDGIELFADSSLIQQWFDIFFDISLSAQVLNVRSQHLLPKQQIEIRSKRRALREVTFSANLDYDVPSYRLLDWPELTVDLGGQYSGTSSQTQTDYRVRALGDLAFMSGRLSVSGTNEDVKNATLTLGRSNPEGFAGPFRLADFEIGDTSQFLPGLIGNSLSGRGLRLGNTRLADKRDLDTIDLQGDQQTDYDIELYVNDRLRGVDRDSSDNRYDFQDVPLQLGQNEIRLEFYGPQGQQYTEKKRSFVGTKQGQKGRLSYEFAMVEPDRRVFDLIEDIEESEQSGELPSIKLSSALSLSYGLTNRTSLDLTIASLASGDENSDDGGANGRDSTNNTFIDASLSTEISGVLLSGSLTSDPDGHTAGAVTTRTTLGDYQLGLSQRFFQTDFRTANALNSEDDDLLPRLSTDIDVSRQYFSVPGGRLSYGVSAAYDQNQSGTESTAAGTRVDYQNRVGGLSWSHNYKRNLSDEKGESDGQVGASIRAVEHTAWALSTELTYSDSSERLIKGGSLRLSRPLGSTGFVGITASRDLQSSETDYTASWNKQFQPFTFSTSVSGSSADQLSLRLGVVFSARRHPGRWLPSITSNGGNGSVAVLVFADHNQNGRHDDNEQTIQGIRITRNGLIAGATTNHNGIALLNDLPTAASVDIGIVETDIDQAGLKFQGIDKGVLPRPGRIPVIEVGLQPATDLEGTVTLAGSTPAPNVRMVLTPVNGGTPMEIRTEFDGYYYLSDIPLGEYQFGPDPEQLQTAGLVARPQSKTLILENLDDFPKPEDFDLIRVAELDPTSSDEPSAKLVRSQPEEPSATLPSERSTESKAPPLMQAALAGAEVSPTTDDVSWVETKLSNDQPSPKNSAPPANPSGDNDADGVLNHKDTCKHTGRGSQVNELGCVYIGEQLSSIAFAPGSANINTEMAFELNGLARELKANPALVIAIETHTDNTGDAYKNMNLSKRRARAIIRYLHQAQDVPPSQLSGIAMGEARPVASNKTRAGRQLNRRVVINLAQ